MCSWARSDGVCRTSRNLSWLTTAEKFFIGQNATALGLSFGQAVQGAARGGGPAVSSTPLVGAGQAVLVLAVYGLAFIAISMLVVRRRDHMIPT
jgi:hypothetical protein